MWELFAGRPHALHVLPAACCGEQQDGESSRAEGADVEGLLKKLSGLVVAVHKRPLVCVDLAVHNRAAEVVLEPCQRVLLCQAAQSSGHWDAVVGAT